MRSHGRAEVDPENPQAFAVCDRCGFRYNHLILRWQYDWQGNQLINKRILICPTCLDIPHEFTRPPILPPDPRPILDARPEQAVLTPPPNAYVQTLYGAKLAPPPVGNPKTTGSPYLVRDDTLATLFDLRGRQLVPG